MHILDILEHGKCSVLLFPHKYHNYNENLQIWTILLNFVNLPKSEKAPFNLNYQRNETKAHSFIKSAGI